MVHYSGKSLLLKKTESGFIYETPDKLKYYFNDKGRCAKVLDKNGNRLEFTYDAKDNLTKVQSNSGEALFYKYNDKNLLTEVSDSEGRSISLQYRNEALVQVINEEGHSFCYEYDEEGVLKNITNPRGFMTISNEYDAQGRVTRQAYADGGEMRIDYADEEKTVHVTEQNGNQVDYIHDERFRSIETIYEDGRIQYAYNDRNQKTQVIDKRGNKTSYSYDEAGNMNRIVNPVGDVMEMEYNSMGKPTIIKMNGKFYQGNYYNSFGNLIKKRDAIGREILV